MICVPTFLLLRPVLATKGSTRNSYFQWLGRAASMRSSISLVAKRHVFPRAAKSHSTIQNEVSSSKLIDLGDAVRFDVANSVSVLPDFITQEEHDHLVNEVEPSLRKRRYEDGHWDAVIHRFREVEKWQWSQPSTSMFERIKSDVDLLPHDRKMMHAVHVLDVAADGYIDPHVDSVKFSGDFVIGLSLISTSIMTLTKNMEVLKTYGEEPEPEKSNPEICHEDSTVRLLLPPRSLYILTGEARYDYAHAILGAKDGPQVWNHEDGTQEEIHRERRISLIFRDEKCEG